MLSSSAVIVLGKIKYGDSSVILKTYSRDHGLLSFIAGGVGKRKGVLRPVMVQPLSQLEIVYYHRAKSELKRIKEAQLIYPHNSILSDPVKNCIALFLADVLRHLLKEEEENIHLYNFLSGSVVLLDELTSGLGSFHLLFLYRLTKYTGFKPSSGEGTYFDLLNGDYSRTEPAHPHFIKGEVCESWRKLEKLDFADLSGFKLSNQVKRQLLNSLLHYYRLHVNDFGELKSVEVLQEVLH